MPNKITIGSAAALAVAAGVGAYIPWFIKHLEIKPIEHLDVNDDEDDQSIELHEVPSTPVVRPRRKMNEHEEAAVVDRMPDTLPVTLHYIHLGDLSIQCPQCGTEVDQLATALGTIEDRESDNGDFNDLASIGIISFPCGHIFYSQCLTNKVAKILNAEEIGKLSPNLFNNLLVCEEHGGKDDSS
jgi:hypothetical protein